MSNKIDFVIMWVDGNDPVWRKRKNEHSATQLHDDSSVRYRDWENLEIWIKSTLKFAPWVNQIFLITDNQCPNFVEKYPKVKHVNHSDYIPKQYLPVFSSNPIELNIHRIDELSEQFVLFNDDMFLIRPVGKEDFFLNGKPMDMYAYNVVAGYGLKEKIQSIALNDVSIINNHFSKVADFKKHFRRWLSFKNGPFLLRTILLLPWSFYTGFVETHLANSYLKSTFEEVWEKEYENLNYTCKNRFRSATDLNQWLMRYWQLAKGTALNRSHKFGKLFAVTDDSIENCVEWIKGQKSSMICINDSSNLEDFEEAKKCINQALASIIE